MSIIRPFKGIRPRADLASAIAALPYDVYNSEEAREIVAAEPKSFLQIDRAETRFFQKAQPYSEAVYKTASETLNRMIDEGSFLQDKEPCYYLYALTMNGRTQTGACRLRFDRRLLQQCDLKTRKYTGSKKSRTESVTSTHAAPRPDRSFSLTAPTKTRRDHQNVRLTPEVYDFTSDDGIRHEVAYR